MAVINRLDNIASIQYNGQTISSLPASTILLVLPTILKAVDKPTAAIGETLSYTVTITNVGLSAMTNIPFTDIIPAGATYIANTFQVNSSAVTPTITANTLTYTIPTIAALGVAVITFQVTVVGGTV